MSNRYPVVAGRLRLRARVLERVSAFALTLGLIVAGAPAVHAQQTESLSDRMTLESYDAGTVLATVGDQNVTLGDLIAMRQTLPPQLLEMDRALFFRELLDRLTAQHLLSQAALNLKLDQEEQMAKTMQNTRRAFLIEQLARRAEADPELAKALIAQAGLEEDPSVVRQLDFLRRGLLSQALIARLVEPEMTDEKLKALYDEVIADERMKAQLTEVRARHILVETKEEAEAVLTALQGGEPFEKLAKERSKDGSGQNGGDLGYFRRGQMVPAFDQAAFALEKPGDLSDIVKSGFGFHVIKLEDKRVMGFEQVKNFMRQLSAERIGEAEITRLKEEIGVTVADQLPKADALAQDDLLK